MARSDQYLVGLNRNDGGPEMKCSRFHLIPALALLFLLLTNIAAYSKTDSRLMAERVTNALKAARKIQNPDTKEITNLILQEKFAEFEKRSKSYEKKFLHDELYESPLNKLYNARMTQRIFLLWLCVRSPKRTMYVLPI
jgi:hypothetical protein